MDSKEGTRKLRAAPGIPGIPGVATPRACGPGLTGLKGLTALDASKETLDGSKAAGRASAVAIENVAIRGKYSPRESRDGDRGKEGPRDVDRGNPYVGAGD